MRYLTNEEGVRMAIDRKRRLRLIHKWRHGLPHTHQPAHRDRHKLAILGWYDQMRHFSTAYVVNV